MSQNDFNIANQGFAAFRGDLNSALQALATNSSGATGPSTTYAYQWWYDTTANILKIRNAANSDWINFASFDQGAGTWGFTGDLVVDDKIVHSGDTNTAIRFPAADTVTVETDGTERMRIDSAGKVGIGTDSPAEQLHITGNFRVGSAVMATPTGSAPLYACRAWVNFDGVTGPTTRGSGNVSSVTRTATGKYTINFTTAMPDANYAVQVTPSPDTNAYNQGQVESTSAGSCAVINAPDQSAGFANTTIMCVSIFR
jgi:hypothetical protein